MPRNTYRPERMITQNRWLRPHGIHNFSIPALAGKLPDGRRYVTCEQAGVCARACYARTGTFRFPQVLAKHERNLARILDDLEKWTADIIAELRAPKFDGAALRVHDAGDFFSDLYLSTWLEVARATPGTLIYCYTKEISRFERIAVPNAPENFRWIYSYGGREDHLIDPTRHRVADVFPTEEAIAAAGWHTNAATDLDAVLGPSPVGMRQNHIPHIQRLVGDRTFREWQASRPRGRRAVNRSPDDTRPPKSGPP
ncbi:hypothetical protein SAMN05660733_02888 [Lentzea albidocapillata]|uniref:Gene product 88 domain-containing protein n=2 Tax=Lentzea TaxID=165301 RepID=A0A1W2DDU1_9PSEU|nr:hypothetical protein SAMN05660733_02888 [Lentzea albidocapillata]